MSGVGWTVCVSQGSHQYLFASNSNPNGNRPGSWAITGEIYKMELDWHRSPRPLRPCQQGVRGFQVVHMMDCRNPNEIVVGEIESWRVQKLVCEAAGRQGGHPLRSQKNNVRVEEVFHENAFC